MIGKNLPATAEDIANEMDIPMELVLQALGTPDAPGPVTKDALYLTWNERGVLYSPSWSERQFVADPTNSIRQQRHREIERKKDPVPDGLDSNESNALRNGNRNAPEYRIQIKTIAEEEETRRMRELPDELRNNWGRAYQFICVKAPSPRDISVMEKFQSQAGTTDRLIVHMIIEAVKRKRRNYLTWVAEVLTECAANGITTPEEWIAFDQERKAGEVDGRRASSGAGLADNQTPGTGIGRPGAPAARTPHSNAGGSAEGGRRKVSDLDALSIKRGPD